MPGDRRGLATHQHEFCFFACSDIEILSARGSLCNAGTAPELTVEHLGLRAQPVTLLDEVVDLLASLQNTLDGLVKRDLGLKQVRQTHVSL